MRKAFSFPGRSDYTQRMNLLDPLFRSQAVEKVFSNRATLQAMLDFEAALARAEARAGFIPEAAAPAIAAKCHAALYDMTVLARVAANAGNLTEAELDRIFEPANYLGVADQFIDRVLASSTARRD
jgi:adenylosuccinate lyase